MQKIWAKRHKQLWIVFWALIACWIIITIYMSYRYIISLWSEVSSKWGTYVEGIFWPTSYLPFLSADEQGLFYQSLLFHGCTELSMQEHGMVFNDSLCWIQTNNNQTFTIELNPSFVWSDGTPVTIDDVYFTYKNIIIENQWWLPRFNTYSDTTIEKISDTSLSMTFNKRSIDNKLFFNYHILPRHALMGQWFEHYKSVFWANPVYTKCAQLVTQSNDINSLVFNMNKCPETNLWFYQVKNLHSFNDFKNDYQLTNRSIIDAYYGDEKLDWYIAHPVVTHAYTTLFFNTNSDKMRIRLRRALAWLINHHFYSWKVDDFIWKDQWIFDTFMSTGASIEEFLTRITPDGSTSIGELEESWVKKLDNKTITFNERDRRHAYYINNNPFSIDIEITTAGSYDSLWIKYGDKDIGNISSYNKTRKTAKHTIPLREIQSGINTYTLYTKDRNDKVINIGSITVYLLDDKAVEENQWAPETTITIIYQNTTSTQKVVQQLKNIFEKMNIVDFFIFMPLENRTEMEAELTSNQYDIAIIPIQRWLKRDLSPILKTNDVLVNPSQYTNPQFTSLFEQYIQFDQSNSTIRNQILWIYTRDIPFMILGKQINHIHVKPDIYEQIFLMHTGTIFENNRRELIYNNLTRASNTHIDIENIWWLRTFRVFIKQRMRNYEEQNNIYEDQEEQLDQAAF